MSKSKEEILRNINLNLDNTIEMYGQGLAVRDALKAMDEYASQALSDYKKQLEAKLVELKIDNPIHDIAHSHNATIAKIILELL